MEFGKIITRNMDLQSVVIRLSEMTTGNVSVVPDNSSDPISFQVIQVHQCVQLATDVSNCGPQPPQVGEDLDHPSQCRPARAQTLWLCMLAYCIAGQLEPISAASYSRNLICTIANYFCS